MKEKLPASLFSSKVERKRMKKKTKIKSFLALLELHVVCLRSSIERFGLKV